MRKIADRMVSTNLKIQKFFGQNDYLSKALPLLVEIRFDDLDEYVSSGGRMAFVSRAERPSAWLDWLQSDSRVSGELLKDTS